MAVNQTSIERIYEECFNELTELEKTSAYECFNTDRVEEYAEAVGHVLTRSPDCWSFEERGFKKIGRPSAKRTYEVIECMLEDQGINLSYYPDVSHLSRAYSGLAKITGDEFTKATTGKTGGNYGKNRNYNAENFSQEHWDALQSVLDEWFIS